MTDEQAAAATTLLKERGVNDPENFIERMDYDSLCSIVAYYDDKSGNKGPGLLAFLLRAGDRADYKRASDRSAPSPREISPTLERAIKGSCLSPNGFTRDMARDMIKGQAKRLGMTQDALIDAVMGSDWQETKADARHDPEAPHEERIADQLRYEQERAKAEGVGR